MSNYTSDQPQFKTCKSGVNCIHPDGPQLPISEFYLRAGAADGRYAICKACKRKETKSYTPKPRHIASHKSEANAIDKLRSVGIYALPGKMSEWPGIDVVAWGCVRIEIKTANLTHGGFMFNLGHKTAERWKAHDLVMLVCLRLDSDPTFHLFSVDDPVFWKGDTLKNGVMYMPDGAHYKRRWYDTLTKENMAAHQDCWQLIEDVRQSKIAAMIGAARK